MFLFRLFKLQTKKYFKTMPVALFSATVFLLLFFIIFYSATRLMPENQPILKTNVGLVTNGLDDETLKWGMRFLEGTESISEHLDFVVLSEEQGLRQLKEGKIIGLVILPENVLEGILYGNNYPATIMFNKNNPLSNLILTELTRSGAGLLSGAQSSTYTTGEIYERLGIADQLNNAFYDVDLIEFKYALRRQDSFFSKRKQTENIDTIIYFYLFAGLTLLLLITTISFSRETFYDNDALLLFGKKTKSFTILYPLAKILSLSFIYAVALIVFTLFSAIFLKDGININELSLQLNIAFSFNTIITIILISLFLSAYSHMLIFLTDTVLDGILLTFITSLILVFISGMILPVSFMPEIFKTIQIYSPVSAIQNALMSISLNTAFNVLYLCAYIFICIIITITAFTIRCNKKL